MCQIKSLTTKETSQQANKCSTLEQVVKFIQKQRPKDVE